MPDYDPATDPFRPADHVEPCVKCGHELFYNEEDIEAGVDCPSCGHTVGDEVEDA